MNYIQSFPIIILIVSILGTNDQERDRMTFLSVK
jgi:hypothetical protein